MTPQQLQQSYERIKRRYENAATEGIFRAIRKQKQPILKLAKEQGLLQAWQAVAEITAEPIDKSLTMLYRVIMTREADRQYKMLKKRKGLESAFGINQEWLDQINEWLTNYNVREITGEITQTTKDRLTKTLINSISAGLSYSETVASIQDSQFDRVRSRLVARTEINRAMNAGHSIGAKALPFRTKKQWLSANDFRVRGKQPDSKSSHAALNGVIVEQDQPFIDPISGAQMFWPGDTSLGAGPQDVCNCRCSVLYVEL